MNNLKGSQIAYLFFLAIIFFIICITTTVLTKSFLALLVISILFTVCWACPISIFLSCYIEDSDSDSKGSAACMLVPCLFVGLVSGIAYYSASDDAYHHEAFHVFSEKSFLDNYENHDKFAFLEDCYFDPKRQNQSTDSYGATHYMNPLICMADEGNETTVHVYVMAYISSGNNPPSWKRPKIGVKFMKPFFLANLLKKLKTSIEEKSSDLEFSKNTKILYFGGNSNEGMLSLFIMLLFVLISLPLDVVACLYCHDRK